VSLYVHSQYASMANYHTQWSKVLRKKLMVPQLVKKLTAFNRTQNSLSHSQVPATSPYSLTEPDQTGVRLPIPLLEENFDIILPSTSRSSTMSLWHRI
jgi:hypothetical protein